MTTQPTSAISDPATHALKTLGGMVLFVVGGFAIQRGFSIGWAAAYGFIALVVGVAVIYLIEPRASHLPIGDLCSAIFALDVIYLIALTLGSYLNTLSTPQAIAFDLIIWWLSPWLGLLTIMTIARRAQTKQGRAWSGPVRRSRAFLALAFLILLCVTCVSLLKPSSLGALYAWIGMRDKAVIALTTAIAWQPNEAEAYVSRAVVYADTGKLDSAMKDASKAIELQPQAANAYLLRGAVYSMLGNAATAEDDYRRCLELKPGWTKKVEAIRSKAKSRQTTRPAVSAHPSEENLYLLVSTMMGLEDFALKVDSRFYHPDLKPATKPDVKKMLDVISAEIDVAFALARGTSKGAYLARLGRPLGDTESAAISSLLATAREKDRRWTVGEVAKVLGIQVPIVAKDTTAPRDQEAGNASKLPTNLSAYELEGLLNPGTNQIPIVAEAASRLALADNVRLETLAALRAVAQDIPTGEERRAIQQAYLRLSVRMMEGRVLGVLPMNAAQKFVDYALEQDSGSIRKAVTSMLGDSEAGHACDALNHVLRERKAFGIDEVLEALLRQIPSADWTWLDSQCVAFLRVASSAREDQSSSAASMPFPAELKEAVAEYLKVVDDGKVPTGDDEETLLRGEEMASRYSLTDAWSVYVSAYGYSRLSPGRLPTRLAEASTHLPAEQAQIAKRLILARERQDWDEFSRAQKAMWDNFRALVAANPTHVTTSPAMR